MHRQSWDDLRFVLAVMDHGSLSAAARELGVNHATVQRRIASFEQQNGGPVFARSAQGYTVLPERVRVLEAAREVGAAVQSVQRLMRGGQVQLSGVVRVSSTDTICTTVLPGFAARINRRARQLRIDLLCSNAHLDFSRMQADITVRPAKSLPDDMVGEAVGRLSFAVYARPGAPNLWLGLGGVLQRSLPAVWLSEAVSPEQIVGAADSFVAMTRMVQEGMGRAVLPTLLGDRAEGLVRLPGIAPEMSVPLWVAGHAELVDLPRIRTVRARLVSYLRAELARLEA